MFRTVILFFVTFVIFVKGANVKNILSDDILRERQIYAAKMISYMNTSVDPCDDFYEYACGNYFNVNKPKQSISIQSALLNIENQEIDDFQQLLEEPSQNKGGKPSSVDKVKYIYQACMNANVFNFKKSDAYMRLVESLGGWPALDHTWIPEKFNWFQMMTTLQQYGVNFLITENVRTDQEYFIELKPEVFGLVELSQEDINRTMSRAYQVNKKLAMKLMEIYGIPKLEAKKAFDEVMEFGRLVAFDDGMKLIMDLAALNVESLYTISNLSQVAPAYDWEKYFSTIAGDHVNTSQANLFIPALHFLKNLPNVFDNKEILRGAANYAVLKLLLELHKEFKSPSYPERFCFFHVKKYMSTPASLLYSQSRYRSKANEDEAWTVLTYTRNAFKDTIMSLDWLDPESKRRTVAKVENMEIFIGYSNQTWNIDEIENDYRDLDVSPDDFYGNNLNLRRHHQKFLHKPCVTNKVESDKYIAPLLIDLNAFYNIYSNKLIIPAVLLVKPYAFAELPKSYNFGSIGRTIGHEMIHGFDSMGHNFNEFAKPEEWWSNYSMKGYDDHERCLEDQYSTFRIPEMNVNINGEDSIQENIADNGGIRNSYYGYKKWLADHEGTVNIENETLPGLNLTNHQLFFLSFGQMFCTRYNSKKAYKIYVDGTYAVEKYRLLGSLSNFDEFSRNFNCKLGTRMNPEKKCVLW